MSDGKPNRPEKLALFEQGFEFVSFKNLPTEYQMAIAWYMAVNGEAWEGIVNWDKVDYPTEEMTSDDARWHSVNKQVIADHLPRFIKKYGKTEFGVATWQTTDVIKSISGDDFAKEEAFTYEHLFEDYKKPVEDYFVTSYPKTGRWPVIMSPYHEETLQDGWHRFSIYASDGHEDIPVVFYPEEWHHELKAELTAPKP